MSDASHRALRFEFLEDRRMMAAGDLDPTFSSDGKVTYGFAAGSNDRAYSVGLQADGTIVAAGFGGTGNPVTNADFAHTRHDAGGTLSSQRLTNFSGGIDVIQAMVVHDNKILVAGRSHNGNNFDFALARYLANGAPDASFGDNGLVRTDFDGRDDEIYGLAVKGNYIFAVGRSSNGGNFDVALARYDLADGDLAPIAGDGTVTTSFGSGHDEALGVAIQSDDKIVIVGRTHNGSNFDFLVARYNANGTLDTNSDVTPGSAFGTGGSGWLTTNFGSGHDEARGVVIQEDGKIVVAGVGWTGSNYDFAVARYGTSGTLDSTFDSDGKVTTPFGAGDDQAFAIALQKNDGKIVVVGQSHNGSNNDFAIARYGTNGALDTSFSGDGKQTTAFGTGDDQAYAVAIQPNGKIVVAGFTHVSGTNFDFALARYEGNSRPTNPGAVTLDSIHEDTPGTGTLVAEIVAKSGATDPDGNSLGIAVTAAGNSNGQWQYSTNDGGSWSNLSSLTNTSARLLAPAHRVRFVPNAHFNSQIASSPTFSFKAWDQMVGAAGTLASTTSSANADSFSANAATATQPIAAVNDAPSFTLSNTTVERNEDVGAVSISGFASSIMRGPAAATDEAAQSLTFQLSGTGTTGGLTFSAGPVISATGTLTFTPAANSNGTATFEVVLRDSGSGVSPNVNVSEVKTFTIEIKAVNDEQTVAVNLGVTLAQGASVVITSARLQTTDVDHTPAQLVYTITTSPSHGTLTPGTTFTQQQIDAGQVSYQHNGSTNGTDSFKFSVNDGQGAASTGTFNITITIVSEPGDYNGNGKVDAADYTIWRDTLGSTTDLRANGNNTGASANRIDNADYVFWKNNFGNGVGAGADAQVGAAAVLSASASADEQPTSAAGGMPRGIAAHLNPLRLTQSEERDGGRGKATLFHQLGDARWQAIRMRDQLLTRRAVVGFASAASFTSELRSSSPATYDNQVAAAVDACLAIGEDDLPFLGDDRQSLER